MLLASIGGIGRTGSRRADQRSTVPKKNGMRRQSAVRDGVPMDWAGTGARHGLRSSVVIAAAVGTALTYTTGAADARHHRHGTRTHIAHHGHHGHYSDHVGGYAPPTASMVIDGNSGTVLEESNPDALRHPASLTKVMTLYLLFERLEA